jgi:hypothetical protein
MRPGFEFLPYRARVTIYTVYGCAVVVVLGIDAWFGNVDPQWVDALNRVILALGAPVMALVGVNARSGQTAERNPDYVPDRVLPDDTPDPDTGFTTGH